MRKPSAVSSRSTKIKRKFGVCLFLVVACAVLGPMEHRQRDQLIAASGAIFFLGTAFAMVPRLVGDTGHDVSVTNRMESIFNSIGAVLMVAACVIMAGYFLSDPRWASTVISLYKRAYSLIGPSLTVLSTAALGLTGYGVYRLKIGAPLQYAYAEIIFAMTSCFVAVNKARHDTALNTVTILGGAIYLTVRGLDNRAKALVGRAERDAKARTEVAASA